jgi:UDP-N-acetylmuramoyl-L-alanyl-D-glutamate--2,6-diaminopimelate ligase
MRLRDLFSDDVVMDGAVRDLSVTGVAMDSRAVRAGEVFFALAGSKTDGARFVDQAIASGAVAVVGDHAPGKPGDPDPIGAMIETINPDLVTGSLPAPEDVQ